MKISVSQIKTYRLCPRKYMFNFTRSRRLPETDAQKFGTKVHAHLEDYLRDGTMPPETPEGRVARLGVVSGKLPDPGSADTEVSFDVPLWPGVSFTGLIDVLEKDRPMVTDHKTTSSITKYAMSKEDILSDEQALGYALVTMQVLGTSQAYVRWLYYEKKRHKGEIRPGTFKEVYNKIKWPDCERLARDLIKSAWECVQLRLARPDPNTLDPKLSGCHAFGGCEHRDVCDRTPVQIMQAVMQAAKQRTR